MFSNQINHLSETITILFIPSLKCQITNPVVYILLQAVNYSPSVKEYLLYTTVPYRNKEYL